MEMKASERFQALLSGKEIDRLPAIEWAGWWNLTYERWIREGLDPNLSYVEGVQGYFGLDRCLQYGMNCETGDTPRAKAFGEGVMENEEDYEKLIKPTLFPDYEKWITKEYFEDRKRLRERGDTIQFFTTEGFFWYPRTLFGITNHLYSFYDYPDLYIQMIEELSDWLIGMFDYVFSNFRFDFMTFAEDMSYNNGPMISKECFDKFLKPYYTKVIKKIHEYKVPVIIDSDGDITKAVDWYAEAGADGMLPLERQAGVDVSTYFDKQPSMAFIGHFDKMCMKFGEEAMRKEFERLMPSMQRGKLVPSCDHQTPPDVSMDNYRIYVRLLKEYGSKVHHSEGNIAPCPVFR